MKNYDASGEHWVDVKEKENILFCSMKPIVSWRLLFSFFVFISLLSSGQCLRWIFSTAFFRLFSSFLFRWLPHFVLFRKKSPMESLVDHLTNSLFTKMVKTWCQWKITAVRFDKQFWLIIFCRLKKRIRNSRSISFQLCCRSRCTVWTECNW